jgi:hypothetical protein
MVTMEEVHKLRELINQVTLNTNVMLTSVLFAKDTELWVFEVQQSTLIYYWIDHPLKNIRGIPYLFCTVQNSAKQCISYVFSHHTPMTSCDAEDSSQTNPMISIHVTESVIYQMKCGGTLLCCRYIQSLSPKEYILEVLAVHFVKKIKTLPIRWPSKM